MRFLKQGLFVSLMLIIMNPITSNTMHIMEAFLPMQCSIVWSIVFIPFLLIGLKSINNIVKEEPKKKVLLVLSGAFVFVLSALKIPSLTGSCSHPRSKFRCYIIWTECDVCIRYNSSFISVTITCTWGTYDFRS